MNLGLFAHLLHIRPWEIGQLPVAEFRGLIAWIANHNRAEEG